MLWDEKSPIFALFSFAETTRKKRGADGAPERNAYRHFYGALRYGRIVP